MKILYHHRTRSRDGQRIHIDGLIGALRRAGHEVEEVGPPLEEEGQAGKVVRRPGWIRPIREIMEMAYNVLEYRALRAAQKAFQPDVIYSRHALYGWAPHWLARRTGLPWLIEVNAPIAWERSNFGGLFFSRLATWLETRTLNAAGRVVVVTKVLSELMQRQGVRQEKLLIMPNGVDPVRRAFQPPKNEAAKQEFGLDGHQVLGFVGFVRDWNRLDRTYEYLEQNPAALLWIIGDGPDRERLLAEAARRLLADQVRIAGAVPADQVLRHVAAFDVAILPEATEYASPLKLLDYFSAGRAVLAPDRPNIREVAEHGRNAWLFEPGDDASFTQRLTELLSKEGLCETLGVEARASIELQGLTWDHNAERTVQCFEQLQGADLHGPGQHGPGQQQASSQANGSR